MNRIRIIGSMLCVYALLAGGWCHAQKGQASAPVNLLDRLAGDWVLKGSLGGKESTHDIHADWVLNHEYLRLHEVSREKNDKGGPSYEAIVFINWNVKTQEFDCLWLDSTGGGGLSAQTIGHAKYSDASIPFIFTISPEESLQTTFRYESSSDTWEWTIDDVNKGKTDRFASVKLTRGR